MKHAFYRCPRPVIRESASIPALLRGTLLSILIAAAAVMAGCASKEVPPLPPAAPAPDMPVQKPYQVDGIYYHPLPHADAFIENGTASWYGSDFHGKKTSNSEIYDMHAMTAAHKTLPFGTMVEVHNLENDHKIIVRINDRGPFVRSRIIDLSHEGAKRIDMIRNGTAKVRITAIGTDDVYFAASGGHVDHGIYYTGDFTIQAGAFADRFNAERMKDQLAKHIPEIDIIPFDKDGRTLFRVRAGRFHSLNQARSHEQQLNRIGFADVFIVSRDM
jgi:rare lipoprotein A